MIRNKLCLSLKAEVIENHFKRKFSNPNIYTPLNLVDGRKEHLLPLIISHEPTKIEFAIWGLLPSDFSGEWDNFQSTLKTINVNLEDINMHNIFNNRFTLDTALIIVSGFYTHRYNNGHLTTYLIKRKGEKPLGLAGTFTKLQDGFYTCSLLNIRNKNSFLKYPNISPFCPTIVREDLWDYWLDENSNKARLLTLLENEPYNSQLEITVV